MAKLEKVVLIRTEPELHDRFTKAIATESMVHGFEAQGVSHKVRELMREFILRVESTAASETAVAAAKALRKRVRS